MNSAGRMSYDQFKKSFPIGTSIGKPFPDYDYIGECVSYWLQKAVNVDGAPFNAPLGHAVDIPSNPTFLDYYYKVSDTEKQIGDSMFWGDGDMTGKEGHVATYDGSNYMMNQNYNGSKVISRNKVFTSGFLGYYRFKGGSMPYITDEALADFEKWKEIGIDAIKYKDALLASKAWTGDMKQDINLITDSANDLQQFKDDWKETVGAIGKKPTPLKAGVYEVKG